MLKKTSIFLQELFLEQLRAQKTKILSMTVQPFLVVSLELEGAEPQVGMVKVKQFAKVVFGNRWRSHVFSLRHITDLKSNRL